MSADAVAFVRRGFRIAFERASVPVTPSVAGRGRPIPAESLRMSPTEVSELRAWLAAAGVRLREGPEADRKLADLRDLYTPHAHQLSRVLLMPLPPVLPPPKARYNWRTTQWGMATDDDAH